MSAGGGWQRRSFLLGGLAATASLLTGERAVERFHPAPPEPRSARPHGPRTSALSTRVHWHAAPTGRQVALTFDDGPDPHWTPRVLDLLARHRVPATFFVVGSRARRAPEVLARTVDAGHEIGNHTWSHADLCRVDPARVRDELHRTAELVEQRTGRAPTVVRPPWGHIDAVGLLAAAELDCPVVLWSELVRAGAAEHDLAAACRDVRPGSVVLAHDGGPTPDEGGLRAVEALVVALLEDGYDFATVSDLLAGDPPPLAAQVALPQQRGEVSPQDEGQSTGS